MSAMPSIATKSVRRNEPTRWAITGREQMQQTTRASASLFDHLVGALLERRYLKLIKSVRLSVEALGFKGSFVAFALF
jgi:hypothetical protein